MAGPPLEPETKKEGERKRQKAGWQEDRKEGRTDRKKEGREGGEEERNLSMYHIDFPPVKNPGKLPLH